MSRVVLAMSGGVDSSVAAWLLREEGHEVIGVFMRHGQESEFACPTSTSAPRKQGCCSAADAADARRVADILGLPFYVLNFEREFTRIVDYFVAQYTAGRTPNPCIVCNTWLKFGKLFAYADSIGAEYVATGHYARLEKLANGQISLCRGRDESKDQSYVLFGIARGLLNRLKFPVGVHNKEEIRQIAGRLGFGVAEKPDSQEICFIPDQDHAGFIRRRPNHIDTSGEIVTTDGKVVGKHNGFEQFTIGQRKGLRVAFGTPRYVIRIEPETQRVVIGLQEELARSELTAAEVNWLVGDDFTETAPIVSDTITNRWSTKMGLSHSPHVPASPLHCRVKIRYRSRAFPALVIPIQSDRIQVQFDEPCHGIAPGQAAVCYQNDRVLGGGWIEG
jgi:tRNA-uridine 2-sulfurtransferase